MSNNSEEQSWWNTTGGQNVQSGFWGGLSMIGGHQQERRNYRNNRNLMGLQNEYQRGLNQQGHDLQMDMWNKTNYGAQVQHMKDAGLNPALMYKGAGPGGTTGSQGGGSASMGSSQQGKVMDLQNMLVGAQIKDLNAGAEKKKAEADKLTGVDTDLGRQNILESVARTSNIDGDTELKAQKKLESISQEALNTTRQGLEQLKLDKGLTGNALIDGFKTLGLDPIGNEEDMYIARGMVALWLGKDYLKLLVDFKKPRGGGIIINK